MFTSRVENVVDSSMLRDGQEDVRVSIPIGTTMAGIVIVREQNNRLPEDLICGVKAYIRGELLGGAIWRGGDADYGSVRPGRRGLWSVLLLYDLPVNSSNLDLEFRCRLDCYLHAHVDFG